MFCYKCGKQIDDNSEFCEYCGAAIDGNTEATKYDSSAQQNPPAPSPAPKIDRSTKRKAHLILICVIVVPIILLIVGALLLMNKMDQENIKEREAAINAVQNSHFEFLPEMTVGEIITEYYGEDYWAYNVDNVVEFWGTNKKDKSGLALHFAYTEKAGIVDVPYIMYHEENETAHSISKEEFENYFLGLYEQLDETNKDAAEKVTAESTASSTTAAKETTTKTTTVKSAETEPAKTTVAAAQTKPEKSQYYLIYLAVIKEMDAEIQREYDVNNLLYYGYYLYDINHDGFNELILHVGASEAEAVLMFYTIDEDSEDGFIELGELGGGHTWLTEKDGKLYSNMGHMGCQRVEEIHMFEDLGSWIITKETISEESDLSDYKNYGTAIKGYAMSDTSAIEALCPEDVLDDKPYVDAYVETYSLSGRDGSKIRLYLDGDFSTVSVQIYNQEYNGEVEFYSKEDFDDYIEMNFNPFAQPPSVVYVTPYSDSGVAGDVITCDIPTNTSGTVQTGGMSYPIQEMKGQINCHGETVAGFTTDYVVNGGAVGKVRNSLGDTWHVTAKNACENYGIIWYELWDSDDGDYYGWVDSDYIDFY